MHTYTMGEYTLMISDMVTYGEETTQIITHPLYLSGESFSRMSTLFTIKRDNFLPFQMIFLVCTYVVQTFGGEAFS